MSNHTFGTLERVNIRTVWLNEALDFTPWLAQNLHFLGDAIGMKLEVEEEEKFVGAFRADIFARDATTASGVIIENQFGRTDHSHLGQLITYASGVEAMTVIWIAERFNNEHRAALDWLNISSLPSVNFFGVEIELWKIGQSDYAPKFNMVSQPNPWTRVERVRRKVTDEEIQKFAQSHPSLTRAQMAAELGISERRLYSGLPLKYKEEYALAAPPEQQI